VEALPNYLDPSVSRVKYEKEIAQFKAIQDEYIKRGIWLLKDNYPTAVVAFAKAIAPPCVPFAASIDFTDYDLRPLSVTLINPFTQVPLNFNEVPTHFHRIIPGTAVGPFQQSQPLLMSHTDNKPFICLPGIREYHEHPAHTGDSWLLHRGSGEGSFHFVVENLHRYGVEGIIGYHVAFNVNLQAKPVE
jgi:hypothetical protein